MKTLIDSGDVFYLKSASVIGKQNILMLFRQESKYSLRNSRDNEYDYMNFSMILWMENPKDAEFHCSEINKYFVGDTLSVDSLNETEIEFIGGYDYLIKVKKYDENIIDQVKEDWIDRYLYATSFAFKQIEEIGKYSKLINEVKSLAKKPDDKTAIEILRKVKLFEEENKMEFKQ